MKKHLIIIPGIGDDHFIYRLGVVAFRLLGFSPQVYVFGWDDNDPETYSKKYIALTETLAGLDGQRYILGVSAGGSVASTVALLTPDLVTKVVTLCAPLTPFKSPVNPLLEVSLRQNSMQLQQYKPYVENIVSLHAHRDEVVPIQLSKPPQIQTHTMPSILHVPSIVFGLTIYAPVVAHFLKQR
ncbi:MAG: alpha/beta hydrolase [Candidatus Saccharimonadales bacterium]